MKILMLIFVALAVMANFSAVNGSNSPKGGEPIFVILRKIRKLRRKVHDQHYARELSHESDLGPYNEAIEKLEGLIEVLERDLIEAGYHEPVIDSKIEHLLWLKHRALARKKALFDFGLSSKEEEILLIKETEMEVALLDSALNDAGWTLEYAGEGRYHFGQGGFGFRATYKGVCGKMSRDGDVYRHVECSTAPCGKEISRGQKLCRRKWKRNPQFVMELVEGLPWARQYIKVTIVSCDDSCMTCHLRNAWLLPTDEPGPFTKHICQKSIDEVIYDRDLEEVDHVTYG